jgi:hypothetical protein
VKSRINYIKLRHGIGRIALAGHEAFAAQIYFPKNPFASVRSRGIFYAHSIRVGPPNGMQGTEPA